MKRTLVVAGLHMIAAAIFIVEIWILQMIMEFFDRPITFEQGALVFIAMNYIGQISDALLGRTGK